VEVIDAAIAALPETGGQEVRADLNATLSRALMRSGQFARSIQAADLALDLAEHLGLERILAETFNNKGSSLSFIGRNREGTALLQAAVEIARAGGFVAAEIRALINLAALLDDSRRMRDANRVAGELARRVGNRTLANWTRVAAWIGSLFLADGWDEVLAEAADDDGEGAGHGMGGPMDEIRRLSIAGFFLVARGESTDATLARLEALASEASDPNSLSSVLILRSDRALHAGDFGLACDEAVRAVEVDPAATVYLGFAMRPALWGRDLARARQVADQLDANPSNELGIAAYRIAARAGIAALEGRVDDAITGFRDALSRLRSQHSDFEVARISLDLVLLVGADHPAAPAAADEARAIFERVRARPYLERLDAAMTRATTAAPGATG
jgi:tetratricopeptide (TPR) repeat protein